MHRIDGAGATADNRFTEGNPATGTPATTVTDDWLNSVQEEIAAVIEDGGGTLDKANTGQLLAAITSKINGVLKSATETVAGMLRIGTQAEVNAGALDDVAVTPKKMAWGVSYSFGANGYFFLPTWLFGFGLQWGTVTVVGSQTVETFSYPMAFPNADFMVVGSMQRTVAKNGGDGFNVVPLSTSQFRVMIDADTDTASNTPVGFIALGR